MQIRARETTNKRKKTIHAVGKEVDKNSGYSRFKKSKCVIVSQTVIFRTCSRGARGFIRGQVALDPIKRDIDHSAPLIKEEIEREIERRKEKKM